MMVGERIKAGVERGKQFEFEFDGRPVVAFEGETVAAALFASGVRSFRHTARRGAPRGVFCGMGVCFDCLARVDGVPNVRTCVTPAAPGMKVETQWESKGNGGR